MEHVTIPGTVKDILEWINNISAEKWPRSIEKHHEKYTEEFGGYAMTDVLYSFLGVYTIGVWVFNKDLEEIFKIEKNKIKTSNDEIGKGHKQILCSKIFLLRLQNERVNGIQVDELNRCLSVFAEKYFSIGNLIPIWPGGNTLKGNQNNGFMDIPELFFNKYLYWYGRLSEQPQAWLEEMDKRVKQTRFESLESFLVSVDTPEKYATYIEEVVQIIVDRTSKINKTGN